MNNTLLASSVLRLTAWVVLFYLNWEIAIPVLLLFIAERMEKNLFQNLINSTITMMLSSIEILTKTNKIKEEEKATEKENINN